MIEETATVVALDADRIWVETHRQSVCGQCSANKGCGSAALQKVLGNKRTRLAIAAGEDFDTVRIGDSVIIGVDESALLWGSLAVYAVPVLAMILAALFGEFMSRQMLLAGSDGLTVLFALAGFAIGVLWLRLFSTKARTDQRYQPILLRRANASASSRGC